MNPPNFRIFGAVAVLMILGALLRAYHLDDRTLFHPEFYTPGLEIPRYVTHPNERLTVSEVLSTPFKYHHPHMPGFDLFLLGWTSLFGTGLFALRMSSVLAGTLLILAVFFFAREVKDHRTALLSSAILALHGYHVHWSRLAKQWAWLALLGVFSTILISRAAQSVRPATAAMYLAVSGFGLWIDSYYWPIFAAQIFWMLFNGLESERKLTLVQIQIIALILAAGALPYLISFSGSPSHLQPALWPRIFEMAQFGRIVMPESSVKLNPFIQVFIGLLGAVLLVSGLRKTDPARPLRPDYAVSNPRILFWLMILAFFVSLLADFLIFLNHDIIYYRRPCIFGVAFSSLFLMS